MKDEVTLLTARYRKPLLIKSILFIILGVSFYFFNGIIENFLLQVLISICLLIFGLWLTYNTLRALSTSNIRVTQKEIIYETGFLRLSTQISLDHKNVESISKGKRNILGWLLDYGSVDVRTSSGKTYSIPFVSSPGNFAKEANLKMSDSKNEKEKSDTKTINLETLNQIVCIPALPTELYNHLKSITTNPNGKLINWEVKEGDLIEKGEIIATINVPPQKHKYRNLSLPNLAVIKSPVNGKIHKITGIEHTEYFAADFEKYDCRRYIYKDSMVNIQFIKETKYSNYPSATAIFQNILDYCFLKFAPKNASYFPVLNLVYRVNLRNEPISFNGNIEFANNKEENLENYCLKIPMVSTLIFRALYEYFDAPILEYNVREGQYIEKGSIIGTISVTDLNEKVKIKSPVAGKIIFLGFNYNDIVSLLSDNPDKSIGNVWLEETNWPLKMYQNKYYNEKRTILMIIQPEKNSNISNAVNETYLDVIEAINFKIEKGKRPLNEKEAREAILKEIKKIKKAKSQIVTEFSIL